MTLSEALQQATTKPDSHVILVKGIKSCSCIWQSPDACRECKNSAK